MFCSPHRFASESDETNTSAAPVVEVHVAIADEHIDAGECQQVAIVQHKGGDGFGARRLGRGGSIAAAAALAEMIVWVEAGEAWAEKDEDDGDELNLQDAEMEEELDVRLLGVGDPQSKPAAELPKRAPTNRQMRVDSH